MQRQCKLTITAVQKQEFILSAAVHYHKTLKAKELELLCKIHAVVFPLKLPRVLYKMVQDHYRICVRQGCTI